MAPRRALGVVMVPTAECNAACDYCFMPHPAGRMTPETVRRVFEETRAHAVREGIGRLTFYWQGGEILLLDPAWFLEVARLSRELFADAPPTVEHRCQSNLLDFSGRWTAVFHSLFGSEVSSSLDHPNLFRRRRGGSPADYLPAWEEGRRRAEAEGVRLVGVISLPNVGSVRLGAAEFYSFYVDRLGLRSLQINVLFAAGASAGCGTRLLPEPDALAGFLRDLAAEWRRRGHVGRVGLQPFADLQAALGSLSPGRHRPCLFTNDCTEAFFSVGPDGAVGLCDCWVIAHPEFGYGNILRDDLPTILEAPARRRLRARLGWVAGSDCVRCEHFTLCYGGCPIRAYSAAGTLEARDPNCAAYRALFGELQPTTPDER